MAGVVADVMNITCLASANAQHAAQPGSDRVLTLLKNPYVSKVGGVHQLPNAVARLLFQTGVLLQKLL